MGLLLQVNFQRVRSCKSDDECVCDKPRFQRTIISSMRSKQRARVLCEMKREVRDTTLAVEAKELTS